MKITVLVENEIDQPKPGEEACPPLASEHGLALLLEGEGETFLFDTGASEKVEKNARLLGMALDRGTLNAIVLSHGHYDHTGGLASVLEQQSREIPVHVGASFFNRKFGKRKTRMQEIGFPHEKRALAGLGARFHVVEKAQRIGQDLFVTGEIPRRESWEETDPLLYHETPAGRRAPDPMREERALALRTDQGLVVLSGCAHRGLINTLHAAMDAAGDRRIRAVIGGAHLRSASGDRIQRTAEALLRLNPEKVALGHCTGKGAEAAFKEIFNDRFQALRAGVRLHFN